MGFGSSLGFFCLGMLFNPQQPAHQPPPCTLSPSFPDLQIRARERGIPVEVIHNASVMNAVGACGLQLYRFGEAISICFFTETWKPDSFYDR